MDLIDLVRRKPTASAFAALAFATVLYPILFSGKFEIGAGIAVGAMAIGATGFVLLIGFAHQLALGQAAFCMIGGYGSAILCKKYGVDPMVALVLATVAAMAVAYLIGTPILRLRGFVLAMASLAFQLILVYLALEAISVTGGAEGTTGVPRFAIFGWETPGDVYFYAVVWLLVAGSILVAVNIERSRIGRALKAIAGSEAAAGAVSIDIARYKVQMFVVSAGLASVTGSIMAHYLRIMDPHVFGFVFSLLLITAVIVGGLMSVWGGAMGAAVLVVMREVLRSLELPRWEIVIMGALTVVVLITFRRGIAGAITDAFATRTRASRGNESDAVEHDTSPSTTRLPLPSIRRADHSDLLTLSHVSKSFGSLQAVSDVTFAIRPGTVSALIGPNGAGKTTLFNLISGFLPLDYGEIRFCGRQIERLPPHRIAKLGISRTFQNLQLFPALTVEENIMCGRHRHANAGLMSVSLRMPRMRREEYAIRESAAGYLKFVGLEHAAERLPSELPFGHQRLVEVARALATEPTLLIMDEPASGLNDSETEGLAELILEIRRSGTTVLLVEHDMRLVMGLADEVVVMNYGKKIATGGTEDVRSDPAVIAAYLGA